MVTHKYIDDIKSLRSARRDFSFFPVDRPGELQWSKGPHTVYAWVNNAVPFECPQENNHTPPSVRTRQKELAFANAFQEDDSNPISSQRISERSAGR